MQTKSTGVGANSIRGFDLRDRRIATLGPPNAVASMNRAVDFGSAKIGVV